MSNHTIAELLQIEEKQKVGISVENHVWTLFLKVQEALKEKYEEEKQLVVRKYITGFISEPVKKTALESIEENGLRIQAIDEALNGSLLRLYVEDKSKEPEYIEKGLEKLKTLPASTLIGWLEEESNEIFNRPINGNF